VRQAGSLVTPDRLRFDFTHFRAMSDEELLRVEHMVNGWVDEDRPVVFRMDVPVDAAREEGALAFFGEKYGETVRVISVTGVSMELCGGTHMDHTSRVGPFRVVSESGIAAGTRRIEAMSGMALLDRARVLEKRLTSIGELLGGQGEDTVDRVERLRERVRVVESELAATRVASVAAAVRRVLDTADDIDGIRIAAAEIEGAGRSELRAAGDLAREMCRRTVLVAGARSDSDVHLLVAVTDDLVAEGLHAGRLVGALAQAAGGKGGGRPHLAEAGARVSAQALAVLASLRQEAIRLVQGPRKP
jgi:alanyl-tRNA synthetase